MLLHFLNFLHVGFDKIQDFFSVEVNRWLATALAGFFAFFITMGRWRKERFLETWRQNRDELLKRLSILETFLNKAQTSLAAYPESYEDGDIEMKFDYNFGSPIAAFKKARLDEDFIFCDFVHIDVAEFGGLFQELHQDLMLLKTISNSTNRDEDYDEVLANAWEIAHGRVQGIKLLLSTVRKSIKRSERYFSSIFLFAAVYPALLRFNKWRFKNAYQFYDAHSLKSWMHIKDRIRKYMQICQKTTTKF